MIVFIAGMQRSGSTFAFNIARDVLLARGEVYHEASSKVMEELGRAGNAHHVILKAHELDDAGILLAQFGGMRVICTVRRPEDAVASWMEAFGDSAEDAIDAVRNWLRFYRQISSSALTVRYNTIDRYPFIAAWRIARYIFADATFAEAWRSSRRHAKAEVKKRTDTLDRVDEAVKDFGFTWYDSKTLYHRRHVSSLESRPAEQRLPADQIARIRSALAEDIEAAGLKSLM